jgi:hypothetical protein
LISYLILIQLILTKVRTKLSRQSSVTTQEKSKTNQQKVKCGKVFKTQLRRKLASLLTQMKPGKS